uniref:Uncharacterized protein n=1 Tax=Aegilops tauschii subsp. strangulata TaxID=200361 RepID=A0A453KXM0_AEGTS
APFPPGHVRAGGLASSTGQTRHYSSHTHTPEERGWESRPCPRPYKTSESLRVSTVPYPTIIVRPAGRRGFDPSHGAGAELGGGHGGRRAGAGSWARG